MKVRKSKLVPYLLSIITLLVVVFSGQLEVKADNRYEIRVDCATTDSTVRFSNEKLQAYKIAGSDLKVLDSYREVKSKEMDGIKYAQALKGIIESKSINSDLTFFTNTEGIGYVNLEEGIYLILGEEVEVGGVRYTPFPILLQLDSAKGNVLTTYMKYKSDEPPIPPAEPPTRAPETNTGDNRGMSQYWYMVVISVVGIVACVAIYRKSKKTSK